MRIGPEAEQNLIKDGGDECGLLRDLGFEPTPEARAYLQRLARERGTTVEAVILEKVVDDLTSEKGQQKRHFF